MGQLVELSYAVRFPVLGKYFGRYCLVLAALTIPPGLVAAASSNWRPALCYGIVIVGTAALGRLLSRLRASTPVQTNEAMILVVGSFLFTSLVMTLPLASEGLAVEDAWFEAVSACTTTGLTTATNLDDRSTSFLFTRAWMQWYGGLGIAMFSVALLIHPGVSSRRLTLGGVEPQALVGNTRVHARRVLLVYGTMTCLAVLLLWIACHDFFDALTYALAAISTGGFAPHDANLAGLRGGWATWMTATMVCVAGAIPLVLYERAFQRNWRDVFDAPQLRGLLVLGLVLVTAVFLCLWIGEGMTASQAARQAPLLGLSAQSTTGFSTIDTGSLQGITKVALIFAMFVGGGLGSTAGGVKIWRFLVFLRLLRLFIRRTGSPPHAFAEPRLGHHRLESSEIIEAGVIAGLFMGLIFLSWIPFLAAGYDSLDALFEIVSAVGTVGLSTGITSEKMPFLLKSVLCCDMLLGRVEVFAFLVAVSPRSWFGNRSEPT